MSQGNTDWLRLHFTEQIGTLAISTPKKDVKQQTEKREATNEDISQREKERERGEEKLGEKMLLTSTWVMAENILSTSIRYISINVKTDIIKS